MVSATTSTRGVITSRTTVSRRSSRASMMNCSWASAPPSTGSPALGPAGGPVRVATAGPASRRSLGLVFVATEHGQRGDPVCSGWGRQAPAAVGAATTDKRRVGLVVVGAAGEQGGHGPADADRVERLHQPALGAGPPGQEDVGPTVEQHEDRHVVELAVGGLEMELEGGRPCPPCCPSACRRRPGRAWTRPRGPSTSGPERASTMVVSGLPAVAAISARTVGASLATRMVGTIQRLAPRDRAPRGPTGRRIRPCGDRVRRRPGRRAGRPRWPARRGRGRRS